MLNEELYEQREKNRKESLVRYIYEKTKLGNHYLLADIKNRY